MATMLPFLKTEKIPKLRKLSGISKYGFTEDDELKDATVSELIHAVESKDHKKMMNSIHALIDCVMARE